MRSACSRSRAKYPAYLISSSAVPTAPRSMPASSPVAGERGRGGVGSDGGLRRRSQALVFVRQPPLDDGSFALVEETERCGDTAKAAQGIVLTDREAKLGS